MPSGSRRQTPGTYLGKLVPRIFSNSSRPTVKAVGGSTRLDDQPLPSSSLPLSPTQPVPHPLPSTFDDASLQRPSGPLSIKAWKDFKASLRVIQRTLGPTFPFLGEAIVRFLGFAEEVQDASEVGQRMKALEGTLKEATDRLEDAVKKSGLSDSMTDRIESVAKKLQHHLLSLREKLQKQQDHSVLFRVSDAGEDSRDLEEIVHLIEEMWNAFERETLVDIDSKVTTSATAFQKSEEDEILLRALHPVERALVFTGEGKGCLPGTRVSALNDLLAWSTDPASAPVHWLNGMAGTGKSTVGQTFCERLSESNTLAATFFCSRRGTENEANASYILPTIAHRMAQKYPSFRAALLEEVNSLIERNRHPSGMKVEEQFLCLLRRPVTVAFSRLDSPKIVVIDGLDECHNSDAVDGLIDSLLQLTPEFPLKFYLASRREAWIQDRFASGPAAADDVRLDQRYGDSTGGDIELYLRENLSNIARAKRSLLGSESLWPTEDDTRRLIELSGKLFIYAATVIRYLGEKGRDPETRLQGIFKVQAERALDPLNAIYEFILSEALNPGLETAEQTHIVRCLSTVVCAARPLSPDELSSLLGLTFREVQAAFAGLHSVISIPSDTSASIFIFHASFQDYVTNQKICHGKAWLVEKPWVQRELVRRCLRVVSDFKRKLISTETISFHGPNGPGQRQEPQILPLGLSYAFPHLTTHLTFWAIWWDVGNGAVLAPDSTWIDSDSVHGILRFWNAKTGSEMYDTCPALNVHPGWMNSAASGFDRIAGGDVNGVIRVWNVSKGEMVGPPIDGHANIVTSIAFSPDEKCLVSGYPDGSIQLWDVETGMAIASPFKGFTDGVTAVGFSPDGKRILSGCQDGTVQLWDAETGENIGPALKLHEEAVSSVAFSPDAKRILTGGRDGTIQICDATTGEKLGEALKCHGEVVEWVGFSIDGRYFFSGSQERL